MINQRNTEGLVSVLVPLFGDFDSERVRMCIESIRNQKGVDLEIVVVEQTKNPQLMNQKGITYANILPTKSEEGFYFPGKVRNYAGNLARGEFIYNNDGDVCFFNQHYFKSLIDNLKEDKNLCFYQPPMRRLPIENFEEFKKIFNENGLEQAMSELDLSQPFGATYSTQPQRIRHFKKVIDGKEEISVATERDHRSYLSSQNKGKEPFFYTLGVHAGGVLMRKDQFDAVGGYCEDYAGWGCHDEDIQWKLRSIFKLQKIPQEKEFEVLHLDHQRAYFSESRWIKNREIQKNRIRGGVEFAIKHDRIK